MVRYSIDVISACCSHPITLQSVGKDKQHMEANEMENPSINVLEVGFLQSRVQIERYPH